MDALVRLYALLLRLHPRSFRERYGREALRDVRARSREPRFRSGVTGRARFLLFLLGDVARSLLREHGRAMARRRNPASVLASLATDVGFAVRTLLKRPGFTGAALVTLALGTGATTAIFSVTDAVLLSPLPYPEPERLVQLGARYEGYDGLGSVSPPEFRDWRDRTTSFEGLAASRLERRVLRSGERPLHVETAGVSPGFFELLGIEPARGRVLTTPAGSGDAVAVVSHGFWERHMGADPDALGRTVLLGEQRFTVVGILPPDFHPPEALSHRGTEVWYPLRHVGDPLDDRGAAFLQVLGRLAPGVSPEAARAEMEALGRALRREHPDAGAPAIGLEPLRERTVAGVGSTLYLFLGAVGLLLAIACTNVAHLFLVRATERRREMAVRTAMGASRGRIARQLLTESLVLSLAGGALGVLLAHGGVVAFKRLAPGGAGPIPSGLLPRLGEVGMDLRVLAFAAGLAVATGVIFGLVPALEADRADAGDALKEAAGTTTPGRGRGRVRSLLLVGETALSLVLLFAAGLLLHSFVRLARVDPGFEAEGVAYANVATDERYRSADRHRTFFTRLLRELERDPRIVTAGATHNLPLDGNETVAPITVEGREHDDGPPGLGYHQVTPGYFRAMGVDRIRGRAFTWADDPDAPPVAVVNETMARRFWPGEEVLGARIRVGGPDSDAPWLTVVGVVEDVRQYGLARETGSELFIPFLQSPRSRMQVVARTGGPASALVPVLRGAVERVDPALPVRSAETLSAHVSGSLAEPRFYTALLGTFAGVALVLAFVGVYGTVAYTVEQRTRELGIRIALGAGGARVARWVVRESMLRTGAGVALGVVVAWASARLLERFVYGVVPTDPPTLAAVALAILGLSLVACYLPARQVTRIDPMTTLRTE